MNTQSARLPPGQQLAAAGKWPIVGERSPARVDGAWSVEVAGLVARQRVWTLDEMRALPRDEMVVDIHCVTRWSMLGARFSGVRLARLLDDTEVDSRAQFISFIAHSERRHSTSLPLADVLDLDALVAFDFDGQPLASNHGGPVRMIVPGRYFYKSVKWLARIELLAEDRLGYWEAEAGYHNHADPWREERYFAPSLSKREAQRLIAQRRFTGRDLRGIDAARRDLAELDAQGALLRDANFRDANLQRANFRGANLSNAHFERAVLTFADFAAADCEGANFCGADLRGADFTGASLLAATFSPDAILDATTQFSPEQIATLMPIEAAYVTSNLGRRI
jgi:DMSO/TMAO reductase YedYZ molybdopterin-dependent catalytic subunit